MDEKPAKAERAERLASALRANLDKRKAQARSRAAGERGGGESTLSEPDGGE